MSLNLHLVSEMKVTTPNGKKKVVSEEFNLYQTPTVLSLAVDKESDFDKKLELYLGWAVKSSDSQEYKYHAAELREFVRVANEDGAKLEFYTM